MQSFQIEQWICQQFDEEIVRKTKCHTDEHIACRNRYIVLVDGVLLTYQDVCIRHTVSYL